MHEIVLKANDVAEELDAAVYIYNGSVDEEGLGRLLQSMQPSDKRPYKPNALLVLTTSGGFADQAYQIARILQHSSKKFYICIPSRCKSAGTLVALGAHEILMGEIAELGPLDVQLVQRDEIGERRSGMVVRAALSGLADETHDVWQKIMLNIKLRSGLAISFDVASRLAADIAVGVMAPVYAQINPEALGNDLRDLNIATAYGDRLSRYSKNVKLGTVRKLVEDYPAHGFIIDRVETRELFNHVKDIAGSLSELVAELGGHAFMEQPTHYVRRLDEVQRERNDENQDQEHDTRGVPTGMDAAREDDGDSDPGEAPKRAKRTKAEPRSEETIRN